MEHIRNIAIIAHVDHGKTTLVDKLLVQSNTFRKNQHVDERVMDSMDLEKEKGITIRAKNAAFQWRDYHVNIVDTPGHADFGGEVERIMRMIDGVLLVVDAFDGPQAQTKFVLKKALQVGAKPIVVINKIDRENARPHKVLDMIFELFLELHANDDQLDFPVIYASAKNGFAMKELDHPSTDMTPLFEAIIQHIPPPKANVGGHFEMLIANLDYSDYLGRIAFGKIYGGRVAHGDSVVCIHKDGRRERANVTALFSFSGLLRIEVKHAAAGNIVGLTGFEEVAIGDTICDSEERVPLPSIEIDPPTIKMQFCVNDGPLAGKDGKYLTARHIRERLIKELRTNVSLRVNDTEDTSVFDVAGRGEMQIAILAEQMRREGYEILVSRPEVIFKRTDTGELLEPYETLYVEIPTDKLGDVMQNLSGRKAEIVNMNHLPTSVSLEAVIPTRGLIGFESDLVNMTRGTGVMSHLFKEYGPMKGEIATRQNGVLIAMEAGIATAWALNNVQERGRLFIGPGEEVYEGMVIGENARPDDLIVNPSKTKHLTNMRSQGEGQGIRLEPPLEFSLERALEYISNDEFVEVTPKKLRFRKKVLNATARKRQKEKTAE